MGLFESAGKDRDEIGIKSGLVVSGNIPEHETH